MNFNIDETFLLVCTNSQMVATEYTSICWNKMVNFEFLLRYVRRNPLAVFLDLLIYVWIDLSLWQSLDLGVSVIYTIFCWFYYTVTVAVAMWFSLRFLQLASLYISITGFLISVRNGRQLLNLFLIWLNEAVLLLCNIVQASNNIV